jgi:hypothetical protein
MEPLGPAPLRLIKAQLRQPNKFLLLVQELTHFLLALNGYASAWLAAAAADMVRTRLAALLPLMLERAVTPHLGLLF